MLSHRFTRRTALSAAALMLGTAALTGCAGENAAASGSDKTLSIDYATYNPLSLVIKEKGWLDEAAKEQGVSVEWIQSAGSNKANEALRADAVDVGSTAGSAALLARSNGSPIKTIDLYSQPEWSALVVGKDSKISSVKDLKGKTVAATKGTDPYFFLLQALEEAGLSEEDITLQNLQHADGRTALANDSVDAWSGLDPIMAAAEQDGAKLLYRNLDFNTYGALNAREDFIEQSPELAQLVVDSYEKAREWAVDHPEETAEILADVAGLEPKVASTVIEERSNLDVPATPGADYTKVLGAIAPTLVASGDVSKQESVDNALATIVDDQFASKADASKISGE
ncbi:aliphatic sulfonate ABC transporter substrate-binding protein [Glutamicibacter sp. JL.03c]|uniref:aliphatic sulfonate ABC transporter substrate-binding protein n=1 Tax=Glutamicibacter sp. JL.03c TaxID=2984842 RepID=UPI0021F755F5|nr:aliphatic sulfonate ABC transporter substrate-binding protein [Glutamicibacter sp. JL.03c]UYQ77895.1 aliphatic sulfonate ABC transporter substrate-binding protein [Glutamicibacter sp. JL.03c]